jgi:hypothetical protein
MRRALAALVALSACGDGGNAPTSVPPDVFCAELVEATCDREVPCGTFTDRATCEATLTDVFDACPPDVNAVALQEADYDAAAAARYVAAVRASACGSALPDVIGGDISIFTPKLGAGAACHSKVSCVAGLVCQGLSAGQGTCAPTTI